ncbi:hypothetical protein N9S02_02295 [Alphaproteobacteria bacterium]|nr:hypothetical protein [Alphaproteobacteria bacterium]
MRYFKIINIYRILLFVCLLVFFKEPKHSFSQTYNDYTNIQKKQIKKWRHFCTSKSPQCFEFNFLEILNDYNCKDCVKKTDNMNIEANDNLYVETGENLNKKFKNKYKDYFADMWVRSCYYYSKSKKQINIVGPYMGYSQMPKELCLKAIKEVLKNDSLKRQITSNTKLLKKNISKKTILKSKNNNSKKIDKEINLLKQDEYLVMAANKFKKVNRDLHIKNLGKWCNDNEPLCIKFNEASGNKYFLSVKNGVGTSPGGNRLNIPEWFKSYDYWWLRSCYYFSKLDRSIKSFSTGYGMPKTFCYKAIKLAIYNEFVNKEKALIATKKAKQKAKQKKIQTSKYFKSLDNRGKWGVKFNMSESQIRKLGWQYASAVEGKDLFRNYIKKELWAFYFNEVYENTILVLNNKSYYKNSKPQSPIILIRSFGVDTTSGFNELKFALSKKYELISSPTISDREKYLINNENLFYFYKNNKNDDKPIYIGLFTGNFHKDKQTRMYVGYFSKEFYENKILASKSKKKKAIDDL